MFDTQGNTLYVDGVSTKDLADAYGTPLYVYSEDKITNKLSEIRTHFLDKYPKTHAAYACKAFCTLYMCRLLNEQGFWLDVVSGGELFTAIKAGFPANRIEFNGNNKSIDELEMALEYGVERIVIDNVQELYDVEALYRKSGRNVKVLFRITPDVSTDTHAYISTAKKDSKFGIPLDEGILYPLIQYAITSDTIDFLGFHFHVGSQLLNTRAHLGALEVILALMLETKKRFGYDVRDFNMGGGFGIKYTDQDMPLSLSEFVDPIMSRLEAFCASNGLIRPHVSMEPGRFIVGDAGLQLYTVGNIKEIPEVKTYVSVDGGMTDNLRPGLYGARYDAVLANKMDQPKVKEVAISGKCCESTDILIQSVTLPKPETGDLLCVFSTGSYGYAMANNYNKIPIPAVVVIKDGAPQLVVRRQTFMDMIQREI
ncbi:MAG TPA: diaminopimelate decarboxylase [Clostridiales bacterium UBA8960]|nr:diaminopimelate decarboxylase [Clostridiales bacterium UBA8960]